jgi:Fe-S-cluster containining protein
VNAIGIQLPIFQAGVEFCGRIDQSPCNGCDACGARCTAGVRIRNAEYQTIQNELAALPRAERERVLAQNKDVTVAGTDYAYTACRFRDVEQGRCLIYPARPLICRLFGHVEWLPCPIEKIPGPVPGGADVLRAYAREELKTYEEWLEAEATDSS